MATDVLADLRTRIGALRDPTDAPTVPLGVPALRRLLRSDGYRRRSLVEWVGLPGGGATTLALATAFAAAGERPIVLVDLRRRCYPPGISWPSERFVVVRPANERDLAWAAEESLRCPAVGAVVVWMERAPDRVYRRWQLAVESGATLGVVVRHGDAVSHDPCWAAVRWRAERTDARRFEVTLLRSRHGACGGSVEVEWHDEPQQTIRGPVVSGVADPLSTRAPAGP